MAEEPQNQQNQNGPRPGSGLDLSRRVERLEDGFSILSKAVDNNSHALDMVKLGQQHNAELMQTKFQGLESLASQTHAELRGVVEMIQKAMNSTPEEASPQTRAILQEYRAFQVEVRDDIKQLRTDHADLERRKHKLREEFDDYVLVEKTKHEAQANLLSRVFGGSLLGALAGVIGLILSAVALISVFVNHPPV